MHDLDEQPLEELQYRGGHRSRKCRRHGAQTFRRGRVLEFLNQLVVRRNTLKQQLEAPEFQGVKVMIQGELKALDAVIHDYIRHFDIETEELQ